MEKAYEAMEEVCQNIKDNTIFSELITDNIMSYISHQDQCVYSDIDDKVQELKKQITKRELLKAPKFEAWRPMGLTDEDWDQIMAAAEEVQHTDDHKCLEQGEHNENGESFEDTEVGVDDELVELSNSDIENEMGYQLSIKKGPSETFQMRNGQTCDYCGFTSNYQSDFKKT